MSYIPDCRNDECYNEKYLKGDDAEFVAGFDWCVEQGLNNAFDNLDVLADLGTFTSRKTVTVNGIGFHGLFDMLIHNPDLAKELKDALNEYIEMERDGLITSCIDNFEENTGSDFTSWKKHVDQTGAKNRILYIRENVHSKRA